MATYNNKIAAQFLDYGGDLFNVLHPTIGIVADGATSQHTAFAGLTAGQTYTMPGAAETYYIDGDCTIPAGVTVDAKDGAVWEITAGNTLTLNCAFRGTRSLHFTGAGAVVFGAKVGSVMPEWTGAIGDGASPAEDTTAWQALADALTSGGTICPNPLGHYQFNDAVEFTNAGTRIADVGVTCEIEQTDPAYPLFTATGVADLYFGNVFYNGEGTWSAGWSENFSHTERGIDLTNCPNFTINRGRFYNFGNTAIWLEGSCSGDIIHPRIKGTHTLGQVLPSNANFQNGIAIVRGGSGEVWGNITIESPDISGVAQGILPARATTTGHGHIQINTPHIHDIPGQHAIYADCGNISVVCPTIGNVELDGVKFQISDGTAAGHIEDIQITEVLMYGTNGGNGINLSAVSATYGIRDVRFSGRLRGCARPVSITGNVRGVTGDVDIVEASADGVVIQGANNPDDIEIRVRGRDIGQHGISVNSASATRIRLYPVLRECSQATANTYDAINVTDCADVSVFHPEISDSSGNTRYGIFAASASARVKVFGSCKISGTTGTSIRAIGKITEFPENADVGSVTTGYTNVPLVRSSGAVRRTIQSTSTSAVVLWQEEMDDESAYLVRAEIVGKLAGSAERKVVVATAAFYRDGGSATQQGSTDEDVAIASASFAGVYAIGVSGNNARLTVHSGATANVDWAARVAVTRVIG